MGYISSQSGNDCQRSPFVILSDWERMPMPPSLPSASPDLDETFDPEWDIDVENNNNVYDVSDPDVESDAPAETIDPEDAPEPVIELPPTPEPAHKSSKSKRKRKSKQSTR